MKNLRFDVAVGWIGAAVLLASGSWALAGPESFFEKAAPFDPYNQHFLQDIGAFQIGLGAALLIALLRRLDGLTVALMGAGIAGAAHFLSHLIGRDLGGRPEIDLPVFAFTTLVLLVAGIRRWVNGPR